MHHPAIWATAQETVNWDRVTLNSREIAELMEDPKTMWPHGDAIAHRRRNLSILLEHHMINAEPLEAVGSYHPSYTSADNNDSKWTFSLHLVLSDRGAVLYVSVMCQ
jgi:hypothetical protein